MKLKSLQIGPKWTLSLPKSIESPIRKFFVNKFLIEINVVTNCPSALLLIILLLNFSEIFACTGTFEKPDIAPNQFAFKNIKNYTTIQRNYQLQKLTSQITSYLAGCDSHPAASSPKRSSRKN